MSEFKLKNFKLEHDDPICFIESQWKRFNPKVFTGYRVLLAILLIIWIIFDFTIEWLNSYQEHPLYWLLFATNWAFVFLVVTHMSLAIICLINNCDRVSRSNVFGYKFCWFMYNLSANSILTTSAIYLSTLVNSNQAIFNTTQSKVKHGLNAAIVLVDLCLAAIPIRLYHGVYSLIVGLFYSLFLVIYYVAGGQAVNDHPFVYRALYWHFPGRATVAVICVVVMSVLMQLLLFAAVQARLWLAGVVGDTSKSANLYDAANCKDDLEPIVSGNDHNNTYAAIE